jgi:type I restriction enzyme, S subunit
MIKEISLSDCCEIVAGQSPPSTTYNRDGNGLPFFQGKADFGEIYPQVRFWCSSPVKIAREGDILISVRAPVGPTNINNVESCIGRGLSAIRPNGGVAQKYLLHYLRSIEKKLADKASGSTFSAITQKDLKNIQIPLPPLPVQQKIAAILDAADLHRQKTKTLIEKYDQLTQSIFLEMFGDPVKNEKGWEKVFIEDISNIVTKGESPKWQGFDYLEKGVRFLTSENVRLGFIELKTDKFIAEEFHNKLRRSRLKPNDLLVNLVGASIGRGALVKDEHLPANINQAVAKIEPSLEKVNPKFLLHLIITPQIQEKLIGNKVDGARANISLKNVRELKIILPPLNQQNEFSKTIDNLEKQTTEAKRSLLKSEDLFNTLLQRAFKGELVN